MNGRNDGFKWVWIGLAGMFILIGVATVPVVHMMIVMPSPGPEEEPDDEE